MIFSRAHWHAVYREIPTACGRWAARAGVGSGLSVGSGLGSGRPRPAYLPGVIQNLRTGKLTTTASRVFTTEAMVPASVVSMPSAPWQKDIT